MKEELIPLQAEVRSVTMCGWKLQSVAEEMNGRIELGAPPIDTVCDLGEVWRRKKCSAGGERRF
jgi:hypothetical protein